jgi:hypothetical protein
LRFHIFPPIHFLRLLYYLVFYFIIELQRVKVYRLNDDGKWDDQGTGHVTVDYLEVSTLLIVNGYYICAFYLLIINKVYICIPRGFYLYNCILNYNINRNL